MGRFTSRISHLAASALLILMSTGPAHADDSEIFITKEVTGGSANLLLIIDSSGSMHNTATTVVVTNPYDSTLTYSDYDADCESNRLYYRSGDLLNTTPPTSCAGLSYVSTRNENCSGASVRREGTCNQCAAATNLEYGSGKTGRTGSYRDQFIRWRGATNSTRTWSPTLTDGSGDSSGRDFDCRADSGIHGNGNTEKYPRPGPSSNISGRWGTSSTSPQNWWKVAGNAGTDVILWSPNRIRYEGHPQTTSPTASRMDVVKEAAKKLLDSPNLTGMNVGLMRYSTNAMENQVGTVGTDALGKGGMILWPVSPLTDASRASIKGLIDGIVEAGRTPLSETLYEAQQYFAGRAVDYGNTSKICTRNDTTSPGGNAACEDDDYLVDFKSVPESKLPGDPNTYKSPATSTCQHNYIVFLTDGLPTSDGDDDNDDRIQDKVAALPNWGTRGLTCDTTLKDSEGQCLAAVAKYMYGNSPDELADLRPIDGNQNVQTYFIGFGDDFAGDLNASFTYLNTAATAGGGKAFQAGNLPQLEGAFNSILADVVDDGTTFSAPTVAVNAFNRTQTLSDLFVAVFQPSSKRHWPGNLKKYTIDNGVIRGKGGAAAVNPQTGFFSDNSQELWANEKDGNNVTKGGAANQLPYPNRKVYTYLGVAAPSTPVNLTNGTGYQLTLANVDDAALAIGNPGDPTRANLIAWANGTDVLNEDDSDNRYSMGDPMHTQPAVVIYGGTPTDPEAVVYMPTNDGYLHAINAKDGKEKWAFIPKEALPQLKHLYKNDLTDTKKYVLDGEVRVLKFDVNGNGIVETGDRVLLFFSQGRGGGTYYAMDVTDDDAPKFLWSLAPEGVGQSWSAPTVARVSIGNGTQQNSQKLVLIMGGGYDAAEESETFVASDSTGNRIYMVDALKGTVLWSAGGKNSGANLELDRMTHAIPSKVTVMDIDSDGLADRMYVGDMAAQVWRFDITNSTAAVPVAADDLVLGNVIASLGAKEESPATKANTRRFFNQPDVAAILGTGARPYLNIAIGSGHRGKPVSEGTDDRLYAIRDYMPFAKMTAEQYAAADSETEGENTLITDADLQDITEDVTPEIAPDSVGWKLRLGTGEKVLTDSTTFDRKIFFVSYDPAVEQSGDSCVANSAASGTNRAYVVSVTDGAPVVKQRDNDTGDDEEEDPDGDDDPLTPDDRASELAQAGIASSVSFLFPEANKLVCMSGVEVLAACTKFNSRIKTFWREPSAE